MPPVEVDARVAELVFLDVLDVTPEGRLRMNDAFREACLLAYEADPSCLGQVVQAGILLRASALGYACVDVDLLALTALEVAVAEEPCSSA